MNYSQGHNDNWNNHPNYYQEDCYEQYNNYNNRDDNRNNLNTWNHRKEKNNTNNQEDRDNRNIPSCNTGLSTIITEDYELDEEDNILEDLKQVILNAINIGYIHHSIRCKDNQESLEYLKI